MIPFVIGNRQHRLMAAWNELLARSAGKPLDVATASFAISGYRLAGLIGTEVADRAWRLAEML